MLALALAAAIAERISVRFAVAKRGLTRLKNSRSHYYQRYSRPSCSGLSLGELSAQPQCSVIRNSSLPAIQIAHRGFSGRLTRARGSSGRSCDGVRRAGDARPHAVGVREAGGSVARWRHHRRGTKMLPVFGTHGAGPWAADPPTSSGRLVPVVLSSAPVYAPIVALLAFMYVRVSPWTSRYPGAGDGRAALYGLLPGTATAGGRTSPRRTKTLEAREPSVCGRSLLATLDARDRYTAGHSAAVAIYSRDIAERMGHPTRPRPGVPLRPRARHRQDRAAPGLLEKPGALTLEERRADAGALGDRRTDPRARQGVLRRSQGSSATTTSGSTARAIRTASPTRTIPLVSRIIAVADAYNAMTSDRPYRDAMPSRVARIRLAQAVERQFDTAAVAAFEAILASADEDYRLAKRKDFTEFAQSHEDPVADPHDFARTR